MVKISINLKECVGCGFCVGCAPEIFEIDQKDFKSKLKTKEGLTDSASIDLSPEQLKKVQETAKGCPTKAISVTEI
jgi:ferredoxin